jgi:hypothetical protein
MAGLGLDWGMPSISVVVPAYRGQISSQTVHSVIGALIELSRIGANVSFGDVNIGDIAAARNLIASVVVAKQEATHLLMSDNDTEFAPSAVLKMLEADKPVIGCAMLKRGGRSEFNVSGQVTRINPSLYKVDLLGTGLFLIRVDALHKLIATGKLRTTTKHDEKEGADVFTGTLYGFFDRMTGAEGETISEDFSFCRRWRELCGGEVYAIGDEAIGHIDQTVRRAKFSDFLEASSRSQPSLAPQAKP